MEGDDMNEVRIGWLAALLLAGGIALGGWWIGHGVERFRMDDRTVTVKGLAEQDIKSDFAIWPLSFRRAAEEFDQVQQMLNADRERIVAFLQQQGFGEDEIDIRPLKVQDLYAREWGSENVKLRFNGQGQVIVKSPNVDAVARSINKVDPLIQAGIQLSSDDNYGGDGPRYQLRGFNAVKAVLLEEATRNAREQGGKFASDAGAKLGRLKKANQGVIRVLDDDGSDQESGRTLNKRLRVVSTFEFELQ